MQSALKKPPLIIPVENQVRELDPKLLLACVAARRGYTTIIGSHRIIDFRIAALPRSLYLCKSFTFMNRHMFNIMHKLGQALMSWDEEALVHLPEAMYFARRLSPVSLRYISHLFAWGEDNAQLWRRYRNMPRDLPIHITGNPRTDLLRPDVRSFYRDEADTLREQYGRFILVNTNFNHVNAFYPSQNLFRPGKHPGQQATFGKAAKGMSRDFAQSLHDHKQALFDHFKAMIPALHDAFPEHNIIVRPHPTESPRAYRKLAAHYPRVHIINEGNVVPWSMATAVLVHNGCTTAVEAYSMGIPAVSYRASVNVEIDDEFYRLPNQLSIQCFSAEQLRQTLRNILLNNFSAQTDEQRNALIDRFIVARDGPLACERVVDVLDKIAQGWRDRPPPPLVKRLAGVSLANGRYLLKQLIRHLPGSHAPPEFHRHRYPGISLSELHERIGRFQLALGDETKIKAEQMYEQVFRISA